MKQETSKQIVLVRYEGRINQNIKSMGLKNFLKKQLSTVIEWKDQDPSLLFYKYPSITDEIKNASKLIVGPGQGCIVVYGGKVENVLMDEGTYFLESDNLSSINKKRVDLSFEYDI